MFKWLTNFRANMQVLKSLKKCMRTYERLRSHAVKEKNFKLAQFYADAFTETFIDYCQIRGRVLGKLSFIF